MSYQILLVEDAYKVRELIRDYFTEKSNGDMWLDLAEDGRQGIDMMYEKEYDLVLLDIMLPEFSGFQVCREIRKRSTCPVVFLTAMGSKENILHGYELGADDYVVKPFLVEELFAKSRALLRRSKGMVHSERIVCGRISLDTYSMVAYVDGSEVDMPTKEYFLLKTFMEQPGKLFNREQLLFNVWGYDYDGNERVIDNHIKKLRKYLGTAGKQIHTVIGRGYRLMEASGKGTE